MINTIKILEEIRDDFVERFDGDPNIRMACNVMINEYRHRTEKKDE